MEAAEVVPGQPARVLASDREVTRLGESVFRTGAVSEEAMQSHLRGAGAHGRPIPQAGRGGRARGGHQRHPRHAQPAGVPGARVGSRRHAGGNHLRARGSAPHPPGRGEQLAAGRQAHAHHRYRRRQRGNHRRRRRPRCGRRFPSRWAPCGCARFFSRTIRPRRCQLHQMHEYIQEKLDTAGAPPGTRRLGPRHRHLGHGGGGGQRGGARCRARGATKSTGCAFPPRRCASSTARLAAAEPRRPAQDHRHRSAARRNHRAGSGRAARVSAANSTCRRSTTRRAGVRDGIIADLAARNVGAELSRLSRDQRREVEEHGPPLRRIAATTPQGGEHRATAVHRAAAPARSAAGRGQAAGGGRLPARRGPLRQRFRPSQAFLLRGVELRHGGLHGARALAGGVPVPLPSQVAAQPGAQPVPSRFRRTSGECCCC